MGGIAERGMGAWAFGGVEGTQDHAGREPAPQHPPRLHGWGIEAHDSPGLGGFAVRPYRQGKAMRKDRRAGKPRNALARCVLPRGLQRRSRLTWLQKTSGCWLGDGTALVAAADSRRLRRGPRRAVVSAARSMLDGAERS